MKIVKIDEIVKLVKIVQNCPKFMSALMLHIYEGDDDGADMMLLIYSLKVVGAQRGSVLNYNTHNGIVRSIPHAHMRIMRICA